MEQVNTIDFSKNIQRTVIRKDGQSSTTEQVDTCQHHQQKSVKPTDTNATADIDPYHSITYQPLLRTIFEGLFCFFIIGAYIPQYIAIVSQGTAGISSRYVLFHSLSSIFTLSLRICDTQFYDEYNNVFHGPYRGWKAISSLLGSIQCIVQFLCAIVLFGLYIHYRSDDIPGLVETSSLAMAIAVGVTGLVVLSVSSAFILINQNDRFDPDGLIGYQIMVYGFGLSYWMLPLVLANNGFLLLTVVYQIKTLVTLQSHGSLSIASLAMQTVVFIVLAVLQTARGWREISFALGQRKLRPISHFAEWLSYVYGTINTQLAYLLNGIGTLVLLIVCVAEGRHGTEGMIRV